MIVLLLVACGGGDGGGGGGGGARSGELSALTYNVHGLPPEITGDDTADRMAAIAPFLPAFDIVGLQEDWDEDYHEILLADADQETQVWFPARVDDLRVYGAGVDVLASWPRIDVLSEHFATCSGIVADASDCLASKGLLVVRIVLADGAELDVYSTHFDAGDDPSDVTARASQVQQTIDTLGSYSAGRAVLFLADTNLDIGDPADAVQLDLLLGPDTGLLDACIETGCDEPGHIDRIWYRSGEGLTVDATAWANDRAEFEDTAGMPLSDHPPISATIEWSATD